ncbi:hypothetical protein LR48_Vigan07g188500 [Vigna angularis]|uniref:Uncharacterized protein n=1 Tax=Phaseolus angularis TaxID=3914 RepID=A0A0L9UZQ0_PHAAN|nr:hypothetical protein LR48_Vigan07g188500 [Vigna angularis]
MRGMKKDDCLCAFIISWILMPRGSNHAQTTTEDLCLLKSFRENIQVDWAAVISENMLKITRLESASLPYCVFISKLLIHFGVKCVNESSESYGKSNLIDKSALHHIGLQHGPEGWMFKDEYAEEEEEAAGSSSTPYRPRSEFEKYMVRQMHFLTILYQTISQDVNVIKEKLQMDKPDDENEEDEESEEESEEDESGDDDDGLLICDMKKNKNKKRS